MHAQLTRAALVTSPSPSSALKSSRDSSGEPAKHKARLAAAQPHPRRRTRFVFRCRRDEGGFREGKRVRRSEKQKPGDNGKVEGGVGAGGRWGGVKHC